MYVIVILKSFQAFEIFFLFTSRDNFLHLIGADSLVPFALQRRMQKIMFYIC